jgi:hypothetical protein
MPFSDQVEALRASLPERPPGPVWNRPTGDLRAAPEGPRELLSNFVARILGRAGVGERTARDYGNRTSDVADILTPFIAAHDIGPNIARGNYLEATLAAVPLAGAVRGISRPMRLWMGRSPWSAENILRDGFSFRSHGELGIPSASTTEWPVVAGSFAKPRDLRDSYVVADVTDPDLLRRVVNMNPRQYERAASRQQLPPELLERDGRMPPLIRLPQGDLAEREVVITPTAAGLLNPRRPTDEDWRALQHSSLTHRATHQPIAETNQRAQNLAHRADALLAAQGRPTTFGYQAIDTDTPAIIARDLFALQRELSRIPQVQSRRGGHLGPDADTLNRTWDFLEVVGDTLAALGHRR